MDSPNLLQLADVKKAFDEPIVEASFELSKGEHVALTGPSGCGKSTLLHLISGVLRPDSGSILFQGTELTQLKENQLDRFRAKNIGYIFQSFHLLPALTALENVETAVTFAGGDNYERATKLLCEMGLKDRLHYLPGNLSVGQRQRVAVARAVVNSCPLVLADEPTRQSRPRESDRGHQLAPGQLPSGGSRSTDGES